MSDIVAFQATKLIGHRSPGQTKLPISGDLYVAAWFIAVIVLQDDPDELIDPKASRYRAHFLFICIWIMHGHNARARSEDVASEVDRVAYLTQNRARSAGSASGPGSLTNSNLSN